MPRNIEIKARVVDRRALLERVDRVADRGPIEIAQDDTFFRCPDGRLKLRELSPGKGELIFYRRDDTAGPKESRYLVAPTSDPGSLRETLSMALGTAGRVRKRRLLFLAGRTRIHLDEVEGLGDFLELEVVLGDEQSAEDGEAVARRLMAELSVSEEHLLDRAYVDMLGVPRPS